VYENNVILRTNDRPTDRPCILENFERPYLGNGSSDPLHVWFYGRVFEVGGSNGPTSGWTKSKMAAGRHLGKFQMAISPQRVVRSSSCLIRGLLLEVLRYLIPHRDSHIFVRNINSINVCWFIVHSYVDVLMKEAAYKHLIRSTATTSCSDAVSCSRHHTILGPEGHNLR